MAFYLPSFGLGHPAPSIPLSPTSFFFAIPRFFFLLLRHGALAESPVIYSVLTLPRADINGFFKFARLYLFSPGGLLWPFCVYPLCWFVTFRPILAFTSFRFLRDFIPFPSEHRFVLLFMSFIGEYSGSVSIKAWIRFTISVIGKVNYLNLSYFFTWKFGRNWD